MGYPLLTDLLLNMLSILKAGSGILSLQQSIATFWKYNYTLYLSNGYYIYYLYIFLNSIIRFVAISSLTLKANEIKLLQK